MSQTLQQTAAPGRGVWSYFYGAIVEALNVGWAYSPMPGKFGDVLVPEGPRASKGADLVDAVASLLGLVAKPAKSIEQARRGVGELADATPLASEDLKIPVGGGVGRLTFLATAPGADWSQPGREAAIVAVYVDGQYHSDVVVQRERTGACNVNLGWLRAGSHRVELRRAHRGGGTAATVTTARASVITGEQAIVERYAPILQLRDLRSPGGRLESSFTDVPMLVAPSIIRHADGSRTITYFAMFSNEDGGTSMPDLLRSTSRGTDYEPIVRITVDAHGNRTGQTLYQGPVHRTYAFDGVWDGDRPVVRVATANNNFSSRLRQGVPVWSQSVEAVNLLEVSRAGRPSRNSLDGGITSGTDAWLLLRHPWTIAVMGKELLREGRSIAPGRGADMRTMVMLSPKPDPLRALLESGGAVTLRLRRGRTAELRLPAPSPHPLSGTAIPLPAGITGADVIGIVGPKGAAHVLNDDFTLRTLAGEPITTKKRRRKRRR